MDEGKYFVIRSRMNGLVLDIQGGTGDPGSKVVMWSHHGGDNQVWYTDHVTGTIRSKVNSSCLDVQGDRLCVNHYNSGDPNQQWELDGNLIVNRLDRDNVLDIVAGESEEGTEVCAYGCHGGENQHWAVEHLPARAFYIVSALNNKVMDVSGADPNPGSKVVMWERHDTPNDNQLWYEDRNGIIRNKMADLVLDASRGDFEMDNFDPGQSKQWWLFDGDKICNRYNNNECIDIIGASDDSGANLCAYDFHGGDNQRWNRDYL